MKKLCIITIALFISSSAIAQTAQPCSSCLPEGIYFHTQAQIDSFQINYPGCTEIAGHVGIADMGMDITNLNGLIVLTSIGGNLRIDGNDALTSLTGLGNVTSIGGQLIIGAGDTGNSALTSLMGLEGLTSIGIGLYIEGNNALVSLTGLNNLTSIGGTLNIRSNNSLTSLTGLEGLTFIGGNTYFHWNNALTSLTGLDNVTSIGGNLHIGCNDALTSLTGLDNLTSIGGDLRIGYYDGNPALTSLTGLGNLTSIGGGLAISNNDVLTSMTGIINLTSIGGGLSILGNYSLSTCESTWLCNYLSNPHGPVHIEGNADGCLSIIELANACGGSLPCLPFGNYIFVRQADVDSFHIAFPNCTQLEGQVGIRGEDIIDLNELQTITSIGGGLYIDWNLALVSLTGLNNLTSIGGELEIHYNNDLTSLTGLDYLTSIGGSLDIRSNNSLTSLTGLEGITSIDGYLEIYSTALTNLTGLDNLTFIGGDIRIGDDYGGNPALTSLMGLEGLTSIGGSLYITNNDALTSLTGLDKITSIGGWGNLYIGDNAALTSLTGLDNIDAGSIFNLNIYVNSSLSECDVQSICDYLAAPNGTFYIGGNAPGCNSRVEIEEACETISVSEQHPGNGFSIYPNPSYNQFTLSFSLAEEAQVKLEVLNQVGQVVETILDESLSQGKHQFTWNAERMPAGIYFYRLIAGSQSSTGKMVVVK